MTSPTYIDTEQWRNYYAVFRESRLVRIYRDMALKRSMFNELVPDKSKKILDLGCGTGPFLAYLASRGFQNLYGVEPDATLIKHVPSGIIAEIKNCGAQNIAFEDCTFDVVFCYGVLHYLKGLDSFEASCNEIYRVLKPGGLVFIMAPGNYWRIRTREIVAKSLGMVSSTFRVLSECLDEEKAEHRFFAKNHSFIKDYLVTQKGFKVIVDKYLLHKWLFTAQKGNE